MTIRHSHQLTLAAALILLSTCHVKAANWNLQSIAKWICQPSEQRPELTDLLAQKKSLNKQQAEASARELWEAYCHQVRRQQPIQLMPLPSEIAAPREKTVPMFETTVNEKTMPIALVNKHDQNSPSALFICLHGGGSAGGNAPSPHGWPVNTREWSAQIALAERVYQPPGIYAVPRMPDDNDGRWWFAYCQQMYDRIIRGALATRNVDPNRVYMLGISEGGYGSIRLGPFMADRWAAVGPMAAGGRVKNAPPENLLNVAFRTEVGERDTTFNRVGLARKYHDELEKLHLTIPSGYHHVINVQQGRGHGVDYSQCPTWLAKHKRNPYPDRIVWTVKHLHRVQRQQMYWLALDQQPTLPLFIEAQLERKSQTVSLSVKPSDNDSSAQKPASGVSLRIYLNDRMLNLDQPVRVLCNGKQIFQDNVDRNKVTLIRSLDERGDPSFIFSAEILIEL